MAAAEGHLHAHGPLVHTNGETIGVLRFPKDNAGGNIVMLIILLPLIMARLLVRLHRIVVRVLNTEHYVSVIRKVLTFRLPNGYIFLLFYDH